MEVKWTPLGAVIYVAMALYAASSAASALRARRAGGVLFGAGFAVAAAGFVLRWVQAGHPPLQNLFEVFLCLGMLAGPVYALCRRVGGLEAPGWAALVGVALLFPAGFVERFSEAPRPLPPALQSPLFLPHVASYMLSYVILALAAVPAARQVRASLAGEAGRPGSVDPEAVAYRVVSLGFPLLTLGLVLGAWWGKVAWGDYWNWDPKELWSLVTWLVYLGYFHYRATGGRRRPAVLAALVLAGLAAIVLTLLWVNLARLFGGGLHSYA